MDLADHAHQNPRLPHRLKPGDTVAIAAPAGAFDHEVLYRGTRVLKQMGFKVLLPDGLFATEGNRAGSDRHRADLLNGLFADDSVDAIMCARGGYGTLRILPFIDYQAVEKNPKIFIGFSDISALLWSLFSRCGLVTFHGPLVTTLASAPEQTRLALRQALCGAETVEIRANAGTTLRAGSATGTVCGGNLTTLCHLVGTPFGVQFADKLLFIEDRGEAAYRIDRMLVQMKLAGCFDGLAGIFLGSFKDCGPMADILGIVADIFADAAVPILAGVSAGHGTSNLTIPMGIEATLDADRQLLTFQRAATI